MWRSIRLKEDGFPLSIWTTDNPEVSKMLLSLCQPHIQAVCTGTYKSIFCHQIFKRNISPSKGCSNYELYLSVPCNGIGESAKAHKVSFLRTSISNFFSQNYYRSCFQINVTIKYLIFINMGLGQRTISVDRRMRLFSHQKFPKKCFQLWFIMTF